MLLPRQLCVYSITIDDGELIPFVAINLIDLKIIAIKAKAIPLPQVMPLILSQNIPHLLCLILN
jgi:hypothetical protein